ncbi:hypothetical protein LZ30DRAFT_110159 [Colletotrichum cereale]|nr:hypothetical protein LZ30DRAFT_110159 [Colletotrichum cereale]
MERTAQLEGCWRLTACEVRATTDRDEINPTSSLAEGTRHSCSLGGLLGADAGNCRLAAAVAIAAVAAAAATAAASAIAIVFAFAFASCVPRIARKGADCGCRKVEEGRGKGREGMGWDGADGHEGAEREGSTRAHVHDYIRNKAKAANNGERKGKKKSMEEE